MVVTAPGDLNPAEVVAALFAVAAFRGAALRPLGEALEGMPDGAQTQWATWRARQGAHDRVPESFSFVLEALDGRTRSWLERARDGR